jgi:alpha-L-fucosidase
MIGKLRISPALRLVTIISVAAMVLSTGMAQPERSRDQRVACIGNSITYGAGIQDREKNSYPAQLQRMLGRGWEVKNFGNSGRTLLKKGDYPYWKEKEYTDAKAYNPDVVIIKLGTNDTKPWNWKYKDDFVPDYESLIGEFQSLPSHPRIYVCNPVPAFPGDWGIRDSVITADEIPFIRKIAAEKHASIIDLYSAFAGRSGFFPDKVHPNEDGAGEMARVVYNTLVNDFKLTKAPEPLAPFPSVRQLAWQDMEYEGFFHFSMNTFTDKEWGYGDEPESKFNPTDFDADEIVRTARDAGMKGIVVTCKHHDGFCLWPSRFTEHSVKNSPWKNGKSDIVAEFSDACRKYGLRFGVYLSPWDRNSKDYGKPEYITYYRNQLRELLTNYGDISEVWFDGANGGDGYYGGARETRTIDRKSYYAWEDTWALVRKLQPNAVMFSDIGPDIRWVGNESGYAGETCWSMYSPKGEKGDSPAPGYTKYDEAVEGHRDGSLWLPPECDVSIRPGWFYHASEDTLVKSPAQLFELYFQSVGHNGVLLLNVPPDRRGRLHENDVIALVGLKKLVDETFGQNLAEGAVASASDVRGNDDHFGAPNAIDGDHDTYWATNDSVASASLTFDLKQTVEFNVVMIQEYIPLGQRVEKFSLEVWNDGGWKKVADGTTIGHKRLLRIPTVRADKVRLNILKSRACPTISEFGLYRTPEM